MKALLCEDLRSHGNLVLRSVARPKPGEGEVRIRVHAVGVNFPDVLMIQGLYQFKPSLPFSPGCEVSGIIDEVGENVTEFAAGDHVLAMTGHGGMAEYVVAPARNAVRTPEKMPFDIAASFIMTYGTSHHALKQRAQLRAGETVLVLGAAGGVGLTAVELAHLMGARVIAAASTDDKLALCREYGAAETINYSNEDLRSGLRRATGGKGVDVIFDPVGAHFAEQAFRSIAWNGRYLVVGFAAGDIPKIPLNLPLIKGGSIVGVFWGSFIEREPDLHQSNMKELLSWYGAGKLRPHISKRFPLSDGGQAIQWIADRKAQGKVIVTVD